MKVAKRDAAAKSKRPATGARTREALAWRAMIGRCTSPRYQNFKYYGARGIAVCARWLDSFDAFLADMGLRPGPGYSLERKDNNGNYEPGNCTWATSRQQARNKRNNVPLTLDGRVQCLSAWAEELGLSKDAITARLRRGWSHERALTEPARRYARPAQRSAA